MKNLLNKGLVVLFAGLFASSVFAADMTATSTSEPAKTTAVAHKKAVKKHQR